uniref:Uncharacterized protein n=1 Tax=Plectus sambesii TaxID=2011161 RepID=A0A914VGI1_9BILA
MCLVHRWLARPQLIDGRPTLARRWHPPPLFGRSLNEPIYDREAHIEIIIYYCSAMIKRRGLRKRRIVVAFACRRSVWRATGHEATGATARPEDAGGDITSVISAPHPVIVARSRTRRSTRSKPC